MGPVSASWLLVALAGGVLLGAIALGFSAQGSSGPDLPASIQLSDPVSAEGNPGSVSQETPAITPATAPDSEGDPGVTAPDDTVDPGDAAAVDTDGGPGTTGASGTTADGGNGRTGGVQTTPIPFPVVTSAPSPPFNDDDDNGVAGRGNPTPTATVQPPPAPTPTPQPTVVTVPGAIPGRSSGHNDDMGSEWEVPSGEDDGGDSGGDDAGLGGDDDNPRGWSNRTSSRR
jgi:hypothetical protein